MRPRSLSRRPAYGLVAIAVTAACALMGPSDGAATPAGAAPVSTGHASWVWGSPTPQGQDLVAVRFQGADGYAVGTLGTILHSTDSGRSWTGLVSGVTDDLDLVSEPDATTVIAAGGCTLLESTDAGRHFVALTLPGAGRCSDPVAAMAFPDPEHGLIELRSGTLLSTADAGATFTAVDPPPLGGGHPTGLAFDSATTGLAVASSGLIERTTDGGRSWTQVDQAAGALNGVTFDGPTLAYAVGDGTGLLRSADGGATWTQLPLTVTDGGPTDLASVTCADADHCLMTTTGADLLVRTADGGLTGKLSRVSNESLRAVAVADGAVVGVGTFGATAVSRDGGRTFAADPDPLSAFTVVGDITPGLAAGTAYLPGTSGEIAATVDRGASWSVLHVATRAEIRGVAFTSARVGFALDGAGQLWRTGDGGHRWQLASSGHLRSSTLLAPSPGTVLLLTGGREHAVYRSLDGGVHFLPLPERVSGVSRRLLHNGFGPLYAIDGGEVAHGDIVTTGGYGIFLSADAGRHWRRIPTPPGEIAGEVQLSVVGRSSLWALGATTLWSTTDDGRHWRSDPSVGAMDVRTVGFASPRDGIVSVAAPDLPGPGGAAADGDPLKNISVLSTRDGGRTWAPEVIAGASSSNFETLATPSADYALFDTASQSNGDAGLGLFSTTDGGLAGGATTLSVGFAHPSISARTLARAGNRVVVSGHVQPVQSAGESVLVSDAIGRGSWKVMSVPVRSDGAFHVVIHHVDGSTQVVAQVVGDGTTAGAGTPDEQLTVTR
jgi:photosystem II stability/assembly factor-like uncharacterized protein